MAERVAAVVPVKRLDSAKSRLAGQLSAGERAAVSLEMLGNVVGQIVQVPAISAWSVVSGEERALAVARELGGEAIRESEAGLNSALELGRAWALKTGADALLIVLSDLPLLKAGDLADLLTQRSPVVIAPSKDGGTNALLQRPPGAIPFRFGHSSAARHWQQALRRGLGTAMFHRDSLAFDVDTPEDLSTYLAAQDSLAVKQR